MKYQVVSHLLCLSRFHLLPAPGKYTSGFLLFFAILSGLFGKNTAYGGSNPEPDRGLSVSGDSTLNISICANEFLIYNGDTLSTGGQYLYTFTAADGSDSLVTLNLSVLPLLTSSQSSTICQGDTLPFNGRKLSAGGTYTAVLTGSNGCDSTATLHLTVLPRSVTNRTAGICTGSIYIFEGDTLTDSGIYSKVYPAANGCDSIVTLNLSVVPFFDIHPIVSICAGEAFVFGNDTLTAPGIYVDSLVAAGGCDSTVTLQLNVLPVKRTLLEVNICDGTTYLFGGDTLHTAGTYVDSLTAANGCDSIITLQLHILPVKRTGIEASICDGTTYLFGGDTLRTAGIYVDSLTASNGCDSIVTLQLHILPVKRTAVEAGICDGTNYLFGGDTLRTAGTYIDSLTAANGCDSIVTLQLHILPVKRTAVEAGICDGATYLFGGETLRTAGTYVDSLTAGNGCDSIVTLQLHILPVKRTAVEASICDGATYLFGGDTLRTAGTYTDSLTAVNGCDSIVTLQLHILPLQTTALNVSTCANQPYPYGGQLLTQSGAYRFFFKGINGCDSIVTVNLLVLPVAETNISATLCAGDTLVYNSASLTATGRYPFVFKAANGCDSVVVIQLVVLPQQTTHLDIKRCEGRDYLFNGDTLRSAGTYMAVLKDGAGCDSTVTLQLDFVTQFETALQASFCQGSFYVFGADTLRNGGVYTRKLSALGGCDSLVTLTLLELPTSTSTTRARICAGESYVFNGFNFNTSGVYSVKRTGSNGCDSIAMLELEVLPVRTTALAVTRCNGAAFPFHGVLLTQSGTYTDTLSTSNGCDSIVILSLTILPVNETSINATICGNETYAFNGVSLTQSGTYFDTLTAVSGCDSFIVLSLTVLPLQFTILDVSICEGEVFTFNNLDISTAGLYEFKLKDANGCDSLISLTVSVLQPVHAAISLTGCNGQPVSFNGQQITASGTYTFTLPNAATTGCDSIIDLQVVIYPDIPPIELFAVICEGEVYNFMGNPLTVAGVYTAAVPNASGCDSIVVLNLQVFSFTAGIGLQNNTLVAEPAGAAYQWIDCDNNSPIPGATGRNFTPTVSGNYAVVVTLNGCSKRSICQHMTVVSASEPGLAWQWSLAPNPGRDYTVLQIDLIPDNQRTLLEVYDYAGRLMLQEQLAGNSRRIEMDAWPDGPYLARLIQGNRVSTRLLVKISK